MQLGYIKLTSQEILVQSSEERAGYVKYNLQQFHHPHYFNVVAGFFMELIKEDEPSLESGSKFSVAFYASVITNGEEAAGML